MAIETLKNKHAFKAFAKARCFNIQHIHTDDSMFNSDLCMLDADKQHRMISFCDVNAQQQIGIVKCYNGTNCTVTRTMSCMQSTIGQSR